MSGWLLAIDTATDALSVAVSRAGDLRFAEWQRRRKGHAEELIPLIARSLAASGIDSRDLATVAATVGPGTFTGVRIGLAAARGIRLALSIPLVGINTLELLAFQAALRWPNRPVMAALDARRGQVYVQYFRRAGGGWPEPWSAPAAIPASQAAAMLARNSVVCGSGADLIADAAGDVEGLTVTSMMPDASAISGMLKGRVFPDQAVPPPSPLYLRAPDAVPAKRLLNL